MRDCALRGIDCILLERDDIAAGTTGRNHGLLHSGARYAVTDQESARECIQENRILKRIASHCVEDTGGLFITLPEDDIHFQNTFMDACALAGIDARQLDPAEALRLEPNVNPALIGAIQVPDGTVDPSVWLPPTCWTPRSTAPASSPTARCWGCCAPRIGCTGSRPSTPAPAKRSRWSARR